MYVKKSSPTQKYSINIFSFVSAIYLCEQKLHLFKTQNKMRQSSTIIYASPIHFNSSQWINISSTSFLFTMRLILETHFHNLSWFDNFEYVQYRYIHYKGKRYRCSDICWFSFSHIFSFLVEFPQLLSNLFMQALFALRTVSHKFNRLSFCVEICWHIIIIFVSGNWSEGK